MPSNDKTIRIILALEDRMSKELDKSSNALKKIGDNLTSLGQKMSIGITAPLVGLGIAATKSFMEFDSAMKEIEVRSGATAAEMEKLRRLALDMGRDTVFSATDAAEAIQELEASGASVTEIFSQIKPVMDLAAAGNIELADSADALTNILKMFNLSANETVNVADLLNQAASASSATVADLTQSFNTAGPVLAQFGMSMGDAAAAFGVLADVGIKGAEAGTMMKSMFLNMTRDVDEVTGTWEKLGVSFYDVNGNARDLDAVFKDLNAAMEGMSMEEQNAIAHKLAGSYGIVAFNALRASNGIGGMAAAMDLEATAAEVAEAKSKTLAGRWEGLMGSIDTLGIVLAELSQGPLTELIGMLTGVINGVTEWARLNPQLAQFALIIVGIVAAFGPLLIIIGQIIGAIVAIKGAFAAFAGLGIVISAPIMAFIAAIVAVIAILWAVATNFMGVRDAIVNVAQGVGAALQNLGGALAAAGTELLSWPAKIIEGWRLVFVKIGEGMASLGTTIWEGIKNIGKAMLDIGIAIVMGIVNGIKSKIAELLALAIKTANDVSNAVKNAFGIASPSKVMQGLGENVVAGFHKGIEGMGGVGVNVAGASGGTGLSSQPTLSAAGASSAGGGGVYIQNLIMPAGTTRQQVDALNKAIAEDAKRRGAKK